MENKAVLSFLAFLIAPITASDTAQPASSLLDFVTEYPNCLVALYAADVSDESSTWAEHMALSMSKAFAPFAFYNNLSHIEDTHLTKFNVNCYLQLVYVNNFDCKQLVLAYLPLFFQYPGSPNELVVLLVPKRFNECMASAVLKEIILEEHFISNLITNLVFLKVERGQQSSVALPMYVVLDVYKFGFYCSHQRWSCFRQLRGVNSLRGVRNHWFEILDKAKNFEGWEVVFVTVGSVPFSEADLRSIMTARVDQLRMNTADLRLMSAREAAYMKIAFILAAKHNFTALPFDKEKHARPVAPYKRTPIFHRRSVVICARIIQGKGNYDDERLALTQVSPMVRCFLYCQKQTAWASKHTTDALVFLSRFDTWTWLCLAISSSLIGLLQWKLAMRNCALLLLAPLLAQSFGNLRRLLSCASTCMLLAWTLASTFVSVAYLAGFESLLIAPTLEKRIDTIKELLDQGYRIVVMNGTDSYSAMYKRRQGLQMMYKNPVWDELIETTEFLNAAENLGSGALRRLLHSEKKALFDEQKVLEEVRRALEEAFPEREFCVGEEKLYLYHKFWAFTHHYMIELQRSLEETVESGIFKFMDQVHALRDLKLQVRTVYNVNHLTASTGMPRNASSVYSIILFSMKNPQAILIFRGLWALLAVATLMFFLEITIELQ